MFKALFNIMLNLMASIIQIICWPVNSVVESALPDLTDKINVVTNSLGSMFDGIGWALGLVPTFIIEVLLFIVAVEIAKHTIFTSTHVLTKVWHVFQKIKFW